MGAGVGGGSVLVAVGAAVGGAGVNVGCGVKVGVGGGMVGVAVSVGAGGTVDDAVGVGVAVGIGAVQAILTKVSTTATKASSRIMEGRRVVIIASSRGWQV